MSFPCLTLRLFLCQAKGFQAVMMSGSGTSIFAMGPPSGLSPDFAESFAKEHSVSVFPASFLSRPADDPLAWYPNPHAVPSAKEGASVRK